MNYIQATEYSEENDALLQALRDAVTRELERKRRLGHYYVIWDGERPVEIGPDAPNSGE